MLQLSEAGARIDEKNTAGATPLHRAANNGHVCAFHSLHHNMSLPLLDVFLQLNIVQALLKEGANPIEADEAGNTPLVSRLPRLIE